ncbi:hypothetical protein [Aminobacter sp. BE322]|uniref:hypothetical protein n=1 Tax=unclassified Aminobacter TaxID=2644704 RepID=UPI003D1BFED0
MSDPVFGFGAIPADLGDKIVADEVGIEFGVHGRFRLRCAIQPVFRHRDGRLTPVAVDAQVVPYLNGQPAALAGFDAEVSGEDRALVARMAVVLALANVHNIGVEGVSLIFRPEAAAGAAAVEDLRFMVRRLADEGVEASRLICEVDGTGAALAAAASALGLRLALRGRAGADPDQDAAGNLGADVVRLGRASFDRFCADAATGRLLRTVVSEFRARGASVLVDGIDSENHLEVALAAGVDLLAGDLLEPPVLVGSAIDEGARDTSRFRRGDCVVIPLFG